MTGGANLFYQKFWIKVTVLERITDFRSLFVRSSSALTPSEKVHLI